MVARVQYLRCGTGPDIALYEFALVSQPVPVDTGIPQETRTVRSYIRAILRANNLQLSIPVVLAKHRQPTSWNPFVEPAADIKFYLCVGGLSGGA